MLPALVQKKDNKNSSATLTCTFDNPVTAGNSIILIVRISSATDAPLAAPTDTQLSAYTLRIGPIRGTPDNASFWCYNVDNITAGISSGTDIVSFTSTNASDKNLSIYEVSGLRAAGSYTHSTSVASGTTPISVGAVTTAADATYGAGAFVIAAVTNDNSEPTAGSGWTGVNVGNSHWYDTDEYQAVSGANTFTGEFTGTSDHFTGIIASFQEAAGAAVVVPQIMNLNHQMA